MSAVVVENLKQQISAIEFESGARKDDDVISTGSEALDQIFPKNGIPSGSLLEVLPEAYKQRTAAIGAVLGLGARLLANRTGPIIWCQLREQERLHLHAPGLIAFGIDPARLIKLTLKTEQDLLWAMEEALNCPYIACAIGVLWSEKIYDFTASRRLSIRAKESDVCALMLRSHRANGTTAADMRWTVKSEKSGKTPKRQAFLPRLGGMRWQLNVVKCKGANPSTQPIGWNRETVSFNMVSQLVDRTHMPQIKPTGNLRQIS